MVLFDLFFFCDSVCVCVQAVGSGSGIPGHRCCTWSMGRLGMGCMTVVVLAPLRRCLVVRFGIVHGKWLGVVLPGRSSLRQVALGGILVGLGPL